mgnify:FL=1
MQLTILMPCLNESETLATCVKKAIKSLHESGLEGEVLIADNGSTDGSQKIAESLGARVIDVVEKGYGSALYHGCVAAKGQWIIMGDSDDSYDFSNLTKFLDKLAQNHDLVMGNRFLGGIQTGAMPWKNRYIGNPGLTLVGRVLFNCPAKDFHCGLRALTKHAFQNMDLRTTGMEFASEMVIKANLLGMNICEVPTILSPDGRSRPPHLRPWRDGWRHLRFMFLNSPRWLFLIPGSTLFLLSLVAYTLLMLGQVTIGDVVFDVHTLFYVQTGLTIGFLSITQGFIARMFAAREGLLMEHKILKILRVSPVLEVGSTLGVMMICGGLFWGVDAIQVWKAAEFGALQPGSLLRTISLSTNLILLGGITLTSSLIMGFLSLPMRR